jgi:hypothetical protein
MANQQLLNVRRERLSLPACFNVKESEPETRGFFLIGSRSESCVARLVEPLGRGRSRCEFGVSEGMMDVSDIVSACSIANTPKWSGCPAAEACLRIS